eukprot:scaffold2148_cov264-Chaetoceros_neogracile.AAC.2
MLAKDTVQPYSQKQDQYVGCQIQSSVTLLAIVLFLLLTNFNYELRNISIFRETQNGVTIAMDTICHISAFVEGILGTPAVVYPAE